ncbi:UDP-2,4-diacetamido-2,4,6-trideoxy-beta-L-altropyranose hydrolase [Paenibacillus sp. KN14-4R]|uniref:UDP-2,4-diacetamido-2,4, 6-trideoxy-beta-L-altropyranose hydrolase n=1 Tax=Paenibacillus sp. KN14-4R TaxID=3445773 RepID=UPI003F9FAB66
MNICFRVDATVAIGTGHFMRSLTLASILIENNHRVTFITKAIPHALLEEAYNRQVEIFHIYEGCDDAEATIDTILTTRLELDWLVVDHYGIDKTWEEKIRPYTKRVMVIDDLANRPHECDLLLDQNYYTNLTTRYNGLVSDGCKTLLGPEYALLRNEFSLIPKNIRLKEFPAFKVLVCFGGSDPTNETTKVLNALECYSNLNIDVVIGSIHPSKDNIVEYCNRKNNVNLYIQTDRISQIMATANVAICSVGSMTWERLCVGLPGITIAVADNQIEIARSVAELGIDNYLGISDEVDGLDIVKELDSLISSKDRLKSLSDLAMSIVDGQGANKVCMIMEDLLIQ